MILFIFLVITLVALIIFFAILTVKKKNPEFIPPKVNEEPDLNKLEHLVGTVKKSKQKQDSQQEKQQSQEQTPQAQESKQDEQIEKEEKEQQDEKKQKIGKRGTPPRKPPTIDLKQAMKTKQFLDRKQ